MTVRNLLIQILQLSDTVENDNVNALVQWLLLSYRLIHSKVWLKKK
jgi:hypothetical protein